MTSSIPGAINALIALAKESIVGISGATVADGWVKAPSKVTFAIGSDAPPVDDAGTAAEGTSTWKGLGNKEVEELYGIPCWILAVGGGTDQAKLRTAAFEVWDAFVPLYKQATTLNSALTITSAITNFRLQQTRSVDEGGVGRYALLLFTVQCQSRY